MENSQKKTSRKKRPDLQRVISGEMKKWGDNLKVIFDAILFCAKNNLALWGTTEVIGQQNNGIFLNLIELISHYYPVVPEHITSSSSKAKKTTLSYFLVTWAEIQEQNTVKHQRS